MLKNIIFGTGQETFTCSTHQKIIPKHCINYLSASHKTNTFTA